VNVGDLVRFWTPAVPKGLQHNGIIIDVTHENVGGLELVSPVQDVSSVV